MGLADAAQCDMLFNRTSSLFGDSIATTVARRVAKDRKFDALDQAVLALE